ncbi:MAG: UPF0175 family protein, partial [Nitrospirae bacterium]|nr:UPF0175 family protein [Nitrospirota bacterium]
MTTIKLKIPDKLAKKLPRQEKPRQRVIKLGITHYKVEQALKEYKKGKITLAKAAELAGLSIREIIPLAYAYGLEPKFEESSLTEEMTPQKAAAL